MPFSIRCGLTCGCLSMLSFILVQVIYPCTAPKYGIFGASPTCCKEASKHAFNEPVTACFIQEKNPFEGCVSTYVLRTKKNDWCVDPEAWWIPQRLKRLEQRGIHCQIL